MRFLVDECTGTKVAAFLRGQGYEVFSVYEQARGSTDDELIRMACEQGWVLVTNDKDFGEKVYREQHSHHGVVLLRLADDRAAAKVTAITRLLEQADLELESSFVVVTERSVRVARQK